jgi:hypothetical protein
LACAVLAPLVIPQLFPVSATQHTEPPQPGAYAGDAACAQCHRKEAASYARTPHAIDSAPATREHVMGSFLAGRDVLYTSDPDLVVNMSADPDGLYQNAVNLSDPSSHLSERFDIAIGSGRHGQTYLYWDDDKLYELPVSYWTATRDWVLSPGMPDGQVHFDRPVVPRCLECHTSYFTWVPPDANHFVKDSIVLGIQCERCHGPGAEHVALEHAEPARSAKQPSGSQAAGENPAILNPARLSRDRQIDLCSLCHAGSLQPRTVPLAFVAGDNIRDYFDPQPITPGTPIDVHGNQVGKLELSKCFASSSMTCSTCHNVHETQEDASAYSRHCLQCHAMQTCGRYRVLGQSIRTKCVDCHMPEEESAKVISSMDGKRFQLQLRTHQIAIYRDASERVERSLTAQ